MFEIGQYGFPLIGVSGSDAWVYWLLSIGVTVTIILFAIACWIGRHSDKESIKFDFRVAISIFIGFLAGTAFCAITANACEPCVETPPDCGYVQVVNPITGKLGQEYVCR